MCQLMCHDTLLDKKRLSLDFSEFEISALDIQFNTRIERRENKNDNDKR